MNLFDMPLKELKIYKPSQTKCDDFDVFWDKRIEESKNQHLQIECVKRNYYVPDVLVYDVTFDGFRNSRIHCTYVKPLRMSEKKAGVVMFHGYNWNTAQPHYAFKYALQGIPVLLVEVRGQNVLSPDHNHYVNGGSAGWMTLGILDPDNYYYSNVYMDCYRAVDVLRNLDEIDTVIVEGGSQGGALTLATAALHDKVDVALADIPYLCQIERAVEISSAGPYDEIYHYFKIHDPLHESEETIYQTLSYVDCLNLASRITCPTLLSIGLEDTICPPSTGFATYNHIHAEKDLRYYPEYAHGGFSKHEEEKLSFLANYL